MRAVEEVGAGMADAIVRGHRFEPGDVIQQIIKAPVPNSAPDECDVLRHDCVRPNQRRNGLQRRIAAL